MKTSRESLLVFAALSLLVCKVVFATETLTIAHAGVARTYVVYVPKSYDAARAVPMLIALHGTNLRGADMLSYTDLPRKAESAGFILVAPDSRGLAFNDGFTTGGPESAETDDVGFIETVAEDVKRRYKIDSQAVFLTGFSSGASMVHVWRSKAAIPLEPMRPSPMRCA